LIYGTFLIMFGILRKSKIPALFPADRKFLRSLINLASLYPAIFLISTCVCCLN